MDIFQLLSTQKDAFSPDKYFTDEWDGSYSYGDGYNEITKGKEENFTLAITITNGALSGNCIDDNKKSDTPATIRGFIIDTFIGFIKEYPFNYKIGKNGPPQKDESKPPTTVAYSGLYDSSTDSFKGVWRIENKQFWGKWTMKRKTN